MSVVGIYGGSFDPIHTGHAMVANFVAQCNIVDEVWLMVSRRNPLKNHSTLASDEDRLQMARLVAKGCRNVEVSDIEMTLPTPSYTINSLEALKRLYPDHQFKIIIGSDSLENFDKWKEASRILKEFGVIVYPRPGFPLPEREPEGMTFLTGAPEYGISSSLVREYIASGWNINYFVPPFVSDFIKAKKLYQ
ncbi:MAG: nicotinate (nicotinamide) nucleotide adenylyltransferase [Muribaculaceae bacterium]|nr:nicotinate (nicotinamide) nucleotide adenylyltransferase [Muribaculaceae bacterium]